MGKEAAISLPEQKIHDPIDIVEMDELYTYIKRSEKHEFGLLSVGKNLKYPPPEKPQF